MCSPRFHSFRQAGPQYLRLGPPRKGCRHTLQIVRLANLAARSIAIRATRAAVLNAPPQRLEQKRNASLDARFLVNGIEQCSQVAVKLTVRPDSFAIRIQHTAIASCLRRPKTTRDRLGVDAHGLSG